jgi:hypothetical protein
MKSIKLIFISIILFLILSCDRRENFINAPEDVAFAKKIATDFYKDLDKLDTIKIATYLSSEINKSEFNKGIYSLIDKGGQRVNVDVNKIETKIEVINNEKYSTYNIEVTAKYEKLTAIETLSFFKETTIPIKLVSYSSELK